METSFFLENKYSKWYYTLISSIKSRTLSADIYCEKHHIIPQCLGGTNEISNMATLTAREHFICHLLLTKMTSGRNRSKMCLALHSMKLKNKNQQSRVTFNSRWYEHTKKLLSSAQKERWKDPSLLKRASERQKEKWKDPEYRTAMTLLSQTKCNLQTRKKQQSMRAKQMWADPLKREQIIKNMQITGQDPKIKRKRTHKGDTNGMYGQTHTESVKTKLAQCASRRFTGKTYDELYGAEKAQALKETRQQQKKEYHRGKDFNGAKNANAKCYEFTDPTGIQYIVSGALRTFCGEHQLWVGAMIDVAKGRQPDYRGWKARVI